MAGTGIKMVKRDTFKPWVIKALVENNGRAHLSVVTKHIWEKHQDEILASPKVIYTWQYDIRWAANSLRREGKLKGVEKPYNGIWELK